MSKLRVFHHLNEGPFCGCWSEGWLVANEAATEEEIRLALVDLAADLSEMCYELNKDENEYDRYEDEEAFLERVDKFEIFDDNDIQREVRKTINNPKGEKKTKENNSRTVKL